MDTLIEKALGSAPFLVIGLAGVIWVSRMFLKHIRESDDRHQKRAERSDKCIDRNTEVIGRVLDRLE